MMVERSISPETDIDEFVHDDLEEAEIQMEFLTIIFTDK